MSYLASCDDICVLRQEVDELALALVTPLRAEDDGDLRDSGPAAPVGRGILPRNAVRHLAFVRSFREVTVYGDDNDQAIWRKLRFFFERNGTERSHAVVPPLHTAQQLTLLPHFSSKHEAHEGTNGEH